MNGSILVRNLNVTGTKCSSFKKMTWETMNESVNNRDLDSLFQLLEMKKGLHWYLIPLRIISESFYEGTSFCPKSVFPNANKF